MVFGECETDVIIKMMFIDNLMLALKNAKTHNIICTCFLQYLEQIQKFGMKVGRKIKLAKKNEILNDKFFFI